MKKIITLLYLLILLSCEQSPTQLAIVPSPSLTQQATPVAPTVEPSVTPTVAVSTSTPHLPTALPPPIPTALPASIIPCGVLLPTLLDVGAESPAEWQMPFLDETLIPADALPAIERFFSHPDDVSLVVYRLGYEGVGFYHNADRPMPLASVSKLIQLVAYANQVDAGTLDPQQSVTEADLEQFYLPRSDLNAHRRAIAAFGDQPLTLGDVVTMMIRYSSNSATDYLHHQLGQAAVEQTAIDLGMTQQSAPCSFLGRFLIMGDGESSGVTIGELSADGTRYGQDVAGRTNRYLTDSLYRATAVSYWQQRRTPSLATQTTFVNQLETRGTAQAYADIMAQIVRGEIGSPATNRQIRDALEWPYDAFASNQEIYQMIGYKNGSLPGVLTSVYYSWPLASDQPYVLALFYKNLPNNVYQTWRRNLPHDAFAHWLMSDPNALHIMHVWRDNARLTR